MKTNYKSVKTIAITLIVLGILQFLLPLFIMENIIKPNEDTPFHLTIVYSVISVAGGLISLSQLQEKG